MKRQRITSLAFQQSNSLELSQKSPIRKNASMRKYILLLNLIISSYSSQSSAFQILFNTDIQSNRIPRSYVSSFHSSLSNQYVFSQTKFSRYMSQDDNENSKNNQDLEDDLKYDEKRLNSIMKNRAMAALGNAQSDMNDLTYSSSNGDGEGDDQSRISKEEEDLNLESSTNKSKSEEASSTFASLLPPRIQTGSSPDGNLLPAMNKNTNDISNNNRSRNLGKRWKKNPRAKIQKRSLIKRKENPSTSSISSSSSSSSILPPLPPLPPMNNLKKFDSQQSGNDDSIENKLGPLPDFPKKSSTSKNENRKLQRQDSTVSSSFKPSQSLPVPEKQRKSQKQWNTKDDTKYSKNKSKQSLNSPNSKPNSGLFMNEDSKPIDDNNDYASSSFTNEQDSIDSPMQIQPPSSSSSLLSSLDGVLPVSELFYKSTPQSIPSSSSKSSLPDTNIAEEHNVDDFNDLVDEDNDNNDDGMETDDEELPFSAEQTNRIYSNGNKIHIRRNVQQSSTNDHNTSNSQRKSTAQQQSTYSNKNNQFNKKKSFYNENESSRKSNKRVKRSSQSNRGSSNFRSSSSNSSRKMVRRGMEMLVGGDPINADPPLRFVELTYNSQTENW